MKIPKPSQKIPISITPLIFMLMSALFVCNGAYSGMDLPQALANPLIAYFDITTTQISLLYTSYSIPNYFCGIVTGLMIQGLGSTISAIIFSAICFYGACTIYMGIYLKNFAVVVIGRAIFGLGSENVIICIMASVAYWYFGRFLTIASGLIQTSN